MANRPRKIYGHFSSLWTKNGDILIPTTLTTQRKSKARAIEAAKRAQIRGEIEVLTGEIHSGYPTRYDSVVRYWRGVRNHGPDGS